MASILRLKVAKNMFEYIIGGHHFPPNGGFLSNAKVILRLGAQTARLKRFRGDW